MKKSFVVVLVILLAVFFVACGGEAKMSGTTSGSKLAGDKTEEYYMVTFVSGVDYWKVCYMGMKAAAGLYGVTPIYTGANTGEVTDQVAVLEQVIAKQPKGIAIACCSSTGLTDTINSAIAQGISIVTFDTDSPNSKRPSYLSTGNEACGEQAAAYFAPLVGKKGKVALLYSMGIENTEARVAGWNKWMKANAPDMSFVYINDNVDINTATENTMAALQANPDLVGLFTVDSVASTAGPTVVKELGKTNLKLLAFDIERTVLDMIKEGTISATIAQGQYNMGYWSMNFLYHMAHNLPAVAVPGFVDTGVTIVTKENVSNYYYEFDE